MERKLAESAKKSVSAEEIFDNYLALHVLLTRTIKLNKLDTVLYAVYKGISTPTMLIDKLGVAKGNLANYCKTLIADRLLIRCRNAAQKNIYYELTEKGQVKIKSLLDSIEKETRK